jgi:hypothetical protein
MSHVHALIVAAFGMALLAAATGAAAQSASQPAKGAPKAPSIVVPQSSKSAAPRTLSGKGQPAGKMLTRDELRACLKRLDDINATNKKSEGERGLLDREREELMKEAEALKPLRTDIDVKLAAVRDLEERKRGHAAEVEAFNKKLKEAEEAPRNKRNELAAALEPDRERLTKAIATLTEEESRVVAALKTADQIYRERAAARNAKVDDWNARNKSTVDAAVKHDEERQAWLTECANRPYREDDEIAIKSGK